MLVSEGGRWFIGLLVYWFIGLLVYWFLRLVVVYWFIGLLVFEVGRGLLVYRFIGLLVYWVSGLVLVTWGFCARPFTIRAIMMCCWYSVGNQVPSALSFSCCDSCDCIGLILVPAGPLQQRALRNDGRPPGVCT